MNARVKTTKAKSRDTHRGRWNKRIGVITVLTASIAVIITVLFALYSSANSTFKLNPSKRTYPIGVTSHAEPSGEAPPTASALTGYKLTYVNNFTGSTVPPGWTVYTG